MIYLIYGEDSYRIREHISELKKAAKKGQADVITLDAKTLSADRLTEYLQAGSLFAGRSAFIIGGIFSAGDAGLKERAVQLVERLPKDAEVIFWEEGAPDRRTILYRLLAKKAKVIEKTPLQHAALGQWINDRAQTMGLRLDQGAQSLLAQSVGPDLAQMDQELTKLAHFVDGRIATEADVAKLVAARMPPSIFEFLDRLGTSSGDAVMFVERLLASGQDPSYLLSMLAYQLRTLILVADLRLREPNIGPSQIAQKLGLHPFVVQKTLQQVRRYSMSELVILHRRLTEVDIQIKTGAIDASDALFLIVARLVAG